MNETSARFISLNEWLEWQENLHFTAIELGLDRCKAVAENLDLLKPPFAVISVAGTNGKGSSVTMLSSILQNAGYNTGTYTSPHLIRYNERIRINGKEVDDKVLCDSFARIDSARDNISLTYFEFGTLAALDIFHRQNIDIALMEVGLGGRLDAVNILDADVALVCSIALDHQFWLGKDRESIGFEKAGIFRGHTPAICSDPEPPDSLIKHAKSIEAELRLLGRDYHYTSSQQEWTCKLPDKSYEALPKPCRFNEHQLQNAAGVIMALDCLPEPFEIDEEAIKKGLESFSLEGRFQVLDGDIPVIMDVAHNAEAAGILAESLQLMPCQGNTHIIIGMLNDKDHKAVFSELGKIADNWRIVEIDSRRATETAVLLSDLENSGNSNRVKTFSTMKSALLDVQESVQAGDRVVITGSFLTVGAAIQNIEIIKSLQETAA